MPKKLSKLQRARLITAETRRWVEGLEEERLLALHDLTHEVMDARGEVELAALRAQVEAERAADSPAPTPNRPDRARDAGEVE